MRTLGLSVSEAGNLGVNILADYTITFDDGRSRVCMDYVPGYAPVPFGRAGLRAIKTSTSQLNQTRSSQSREGTNVKRRFSRRNGVS